MCQSTFRSDYIKLIFNRTNVEGRIVINYGYLRPWNVVNRFIMRMHKMEADYFPGASKCQYAWQFSIGNFRQKPTTMDEVFKYLTIIVE